MIQWCFLLSSSSSPSLSRSQVPSSALEIYQHSEVFRRHMGNLDLIVNMYNGIQTTLLPVERPLLKNQLDKINKLLSQGVGGSPAAISLNRTSTIIAVVSRTTANVRASGASLAPNTWREDMSWSIFVLTYLL